MGNILTHIRDFKVTAHPAVTTSQKLWEDCGVKLTGKDFKAQFVGLEVEAVEAGILSISKLQKNSLDATILSELGIKAETSVLHFAELLHQNRKSSEIFIGYLRGLDGKLWAVFASWFAGDDGWFVDPSSVTDPVWWDVGYRVVSRLPTRKAGK